MGSQIYVASAASGDASAPHAQAVPVEARSLFRSPVDAVEALYRDEKPGLLRRLRRRSPGTDEALDTVHEAFLRLLRLGSTRIATLDQEQPAAYLNRTIGNLTRDGQKLGLRRSAHLHVMADETVLAGPDPHRHIEARDKLRRLEAAMLQLRPRPRAIFIAHRVQGLSYAEIATQCGISVKGVEKHMAYAIAAIDRLMVRD